MHNQIIQCFEGFLLNLCCLKDFFELVIGAIFYFFESFVRLFVQPPPKDVEGEIALVTGAAQGIGKLIAKELGRHGATLVLWDVNWEALDRTARELRRILDVRVYAYACDCSRRTEVYKVAELVKYCYIRTGQCVYRKTTLTQSDSTLCITTSKYHKQLRHETTFLLRQHHFFCYRLII